MTNPAFTVKSESTWHVISYDVQEKLIFDDNVPDRIADFSVRCLYTIIADITLSDDCIRQFKYYGEVFYSVSEKSYIIRFNQPYNRKTVFRFTVNKGICEPIGFGTALSWAVGMHKQKIDHYLCGRAEKLGAKVVRKQSIWF